MRHSFLFIGMHFPISVRKFLAHFRTVYLHKVHSICKSIDLPTLTLYARVSRLFAGNPLTKPL